jgi:hypothetical protein
LPTLRLIPGLGSPLLSLHPFSYLLQPGKHIRRRQLVLLVVRIIARW